MSLHAKLNGLLKTNATNLKPYSITSSLVHVHPSAMVVHLVLVQVWVLVHPRLNLLANNFTLEILDLQETIV